MPTFSTRTRRARDSGIAGGPIEVLLVNSGILGHRAVATLLRDALATRPEIRARHVDLAAGLTRVERLVRRVLCLRPFGASPLTRANLDLARWRHELHAGLLARRRIGAAVRTGRCDVLHCHTQAVAYASLGRMRQLPTIVSMDCTQRQASLELPSRVARLTYRANSIHDGLVFRRAAAITATSQWAADDLRRQYPDVHAPIHVLPYPVPLAGFDPRWPEQRHDRARATGYKVRVLFVGGDFPRKGGPELLRAWRVGRLAEHASLTVVTGWPLSRSALPPGVTIERHVAPYTTRWLELWRWADVFVMPSKGEAFGMVYQEAGAAGLPAIAPRLNAVPEIIDDGVTGLLLPPADDGGELIGALRGLIDSPERRRVMGVRARDRMATHGAPERFAAHLAALVAQAARSRPRGTAWPDRAAVA